MSREYEDLLASLYSLEAAKGMDFKLERVALALHHLGDPHRRYPIIHVAGTNGKGSVAAMLHCMLGVAGQRVGLYTSPHLVHFTERIRVGDDEIREESVVSLARAVQRVSSQHSIALTFFEVVTVMAFLHFARAEVSVAVIEAGLGGRLDATNVVDPMLSVITGIGLDHQEFLGSSLESIAREKAGIIKPGRAVVVGAVGDAARAVIAAAAAAQEAPTLWADRDFELSPEGVGLCFRGPGGKIDSLTLGLIGTHQIANAAVAIMTALALPADLRPPTEAIRRGLATVRWPGRVDVVQHAPRVILDGAHNPDGVAALLRALQAITGEEPVHLLFSVMRDKDWPAMIDLLLPAVSRVTVTRALPQRSVEPEELGARFPSTLPVAVIDEPLAALEAALQNVAADETLLVCGSLFLVGAVYPYFLERTGRHGVFESRGTLHP